MDRLRKTAIPMPSRRGWMLGFLIFFGLLILVSAYYFTGDQITSSSTDYALEEKTQEANSGAKKDAARFQPMLSPIVPSTPPKKKISIDKKKEEPNNIEDTEEKKSTTETEKKNTDSTSKKEPQAEKPDDSSEKVKKNKDGSTGGKKEEGQSDKKKDSQKSEPSTSIHNPPKNTSDLQKTGKSSSEVAEQKIEKTVSVFISEGLKVYASLVENLHTFQRRKKGEKIPMVITEDVRRDGKVVFRKGDPVLANLTDFRYAGDGEKALIELEIWRAQSASGEWINMKRGKYRQPGGKRERLEFSTAARFEIQTDERKTITYKTHK